MASINAWIGAQYAQGVLILLESAYGDAQQADDVQHFIKTGDDATFRRLHRVCGSGESRAEFFSRFACMNLVSESVGQDNTHKVKPAQLRAGAATLAERLQQLQPRVVWVASKRAQKYALPVLAQLDVEVITTAHPLYPVNISDDELLAAWQQAQGVVVKGTAEAFSRPIARELVKGTVAALRGPIAPETVPEWFVGLMRAIIKEYGLSWEYLRTYYALEELRGNQVMARRVLSKQLRKMEKRSRTAKANASGSRMADPMAVLKHKIEYMAAHNGSTRGWMKSARSDFAKDDKPCSVRLINAALKTAQDMSAEK